MWLLLLLLFVFTPDGGGVFILLVVDEGAADGFDLDDINLEGAEDGGGSPTVVEVEVDVEKGERVIFLPFPYVCSKK